MDIALDNLDLSFADDPVLQHLLEDTEVTVTITPTDVGLQISTAGPAVAKSLSGEIE